MPGFTKNYDDISDIATTPEIVSALQKIEITDVHDVETIAQNSSLVRIPQGWTPLKQWDKGDKVYFILSGEFTVVKNKVVLTNLTDSDFFGEITALKKYPDGPVHLRNASVVAKTDSTVLHFTEEQFVFLLENVSSFKEHVQEVFEKRTS